MGTRADFYMGKNETAEWLGSIAWDGYREGIPDPILKATDETVFRDLVTAFIAAREDGTKPEQGWPWPWDDSGTTDCSYWFDNGEVWQAHWRGPYIRVSEPETDDEPTGEPVSFPNMSSRKNVTLGKRSGVIIVRSP